LVSFSAEWFARQNDHTARIDQLQQNNERDRGRKYQEVHFALGADFSLYSTAPLWHDQFTGNPGKGKKRK